MGSASASQSALGKSCRWIIRASPGGWLARESRRALRANYAHAVVGVVAGRGIAHVVSGRRGYADSDGSTSWGVRLTRRPGSLICVCARRHRRTRHRSRYPCAGGSTKAGACASAFCRLPVVPGAGFIVAEDLGAIAGRRRPKNHCPLPRASRRGSSRRARREILPETRSPPRRSTQVLTLSKAFLAVIDPRGVFPDRDREPARFGPWVENACLAHGWKCGTAGELLALGTDRG